MKLALSEYRDSTVARSAFTLVEIMIVVSLIGLLLAIAIPRFVKSRESAQLNSIYSNLRVVESAKDQWALQNQKGTGDTTDWSLLAEYLKGGTIKPATSEAYTINAVGTSAYATCNVTLGTYAPTDPITAQ
jgi:prepilin-type N-terminal cleavage/methylation domain-containing protein